MTMTMTMTMMALEPELEAAVAHLTKHLGEQDQVMTTRAMMAMMTFKMQKETFCPPLI